MAKPDMSGEIEAWNKIAEKLQAGHKLRDLGKPFTIAGSTALRDPGRAGVGLCECGATSRKLYSDVARRRWHREHLDSLGIGPRAVTSAMLAGKEPGDAPA